MTAEKIIPAMQAIAAWEQAIARRPGRDKGGREFCPVARAWRPCGAVLGHSAGRLDALSCGESVEAVSLKNTMKNTMGNNAMRARGGGTLRDGGGQSCYAFLAGHFPLNKR